MTNQKVVKKKHRDREFRMDAAKMIVEGGRRTGDVAKELGHTYPTVTSWVKAYKAEKSAPKLSTSELQLLAVKERSEERRVGQECVP